MAARCRRRLSSEGPSGGEGPPVALGEKLLMVSDSGCAQEPDGAVGWLPVFERGGGLAEDGAPPRQTRNNGIWEREKADARRRVSGQRACAGVLAAANNVVLAPWRMRRGPWQAPILPGRNTNEVSARRFARSGGCPCPRCAVLGSSLRTTQQPNHGSQILLRCTVIVIDPQASSTSTIAAKTVCVFAQSRVRSAPMPGQPMAAPSRVLVAPCEELYLISLRMPQ